MDRRTFATGLAVAAGGMMLPRLAGAQAAPAAPPAPATAPAPAPGPDAEAVRAGKNFIETKVYSLAEDKAILDLFKPLRVADVIDGMDRVGLRGIGAVSHEIQPLWKDTVQYTHRIVGIAVTARYVPAIEPARGNMDTAAFDAWVKEWYANTSSEPFRPILREGSVLVIDESPDIDVGSIGSNNILGVKRAGGVGVISNGTGVRDTDEIVTEKIPVYFRHPGRGIRPGRNMIESVNRPIVLGGALVRPGDVVVADGDGVIVCPRDHARPIGEYAKKTVDEDKAARKLQYEQMGIPADASVR